MLENSKNQKAARMPQDCTETKEGNSMPPNNTSRKKTFYGVFMSDDRDEGKCKLMSKETPLNFLPTLLEAQLYAEKKTKLFVEAYKRQFGQNKAMWVTNRDYMIRYSDSVMPKYLHLEIKDIICDTTLDTPSLRLQGDTNNANLQHTIDALRAELSAVKARNAAAAAYATMWDAGIDCSKEAILENLIAVRNLLSPDSSDNYIIRLFKKWQESHESQILTQLQPLVASLQNISSNIASIVK